MPGGGSGGSPVGKSSRNDRLYGRADNAWRLPAQIPAVNRASATPPSLDLILFKRKLGKSPTFLNKWLAYQNFLSL
jgi:hypothetical protein